MQGLRAPINGRADAAAGITGAFKPVTRMRHDAVKERLLVFGEMTQRV